MVRSWYLLQWRPRADEVQDEFMGILLHPGRDVPIDLWGGGETQGLRPLGAVCWGRAKRISLNPEQDCPQTLLRWLPGSSLHLGLFAQNAGRVVMRVR